MNIPKYSKLFIRIVRETSVRESDCPGNVRYTRTRTLQSSDGTRSGAPFAQASVAMPRFWRTSDARSTNSVTT